MLLFMSLLLFTRIAWCNHVGSTLFYNRLGRAGCWTQEDIARLRARKIFEDNFIPPVIPLQRVNDDYIKETLRYFQNALKSTEKGLDRQTAAILEDVLMDTIGAHMRSEILPTVRFAFYAGYVPYRRVRELHDFYEQLKESLNTQGLGWNRPSRVPKLSNITVEKIRIGPGKYYSDPCSNLVTKRDANSCIHLPPLETDDGLLPSALKLPFKSGGLVSLTSPKSQNILLKYYSTASRCILHNSPESCRHTDFVNFNNELWHWMKKDVAPHLVDENLYAAYGGVLRMAAAAQNYGKGISRRNLFEYQDPEVSKWHPWKTLRQSYVSINSDWTPLLYVAVVMMIGLAICLIQVCYSYLLDDSGCHCKATPRQSSSYKDVSYANVDSNFPAMLPSHQNAVYYTEQTQRRRSSSKNRTSSLASIQTQRVFDMHENKEKLMPVIMNNDDETSEDSPRSKSCENGIENNRGINVSQTVRSKSPPELDTPVTQIQRKAPKAREKTQTPMFATSTVTNSVLTYQKGQETESWSESASSTSGRSFSSTDSKYRRRRSRGSHDLEWARRVISKHSLHAKSSGTELDINSFVTPKSHR
ncbi:uncharacterized protein LOC120637926 [Pararge aegeria]|uniref:Jg5763 protein n=1 Tax=Pararge aegeria aegeria TaxID=348720 RepID=A0A8S4SF31_9NEOP|nr:uncharacterized protein LOC120637926 [Pararge aegeria]CAH2267827.1 jg5763 [Pararge aegeria aegeria]